MASKLYPIGFARILDTAADLNDGNVKVILVDGTVTYNDDHDYLADVEAGIVDGTAAKTLANPAVTVVSDTTVKFDADDPTDWTEVTDANDVGAAIVYYDTGNSATAPLIAFCDGTDLVTNGSDVGLDFGANGIFTLDLS